MSILTAIVSFEDSVFLASNRPRWLASEAKIAPHVDELALHFMSTSYDRK